MREKLIQLLKGADEHSIRRCITDYDEATSDNAEFLAENGVIVLPCKVGDTVYDILHTNIQEWTVSYITVEKNRIYVRLSSKSTPARIGVSAKLFGKKVFLTREEAEAAISAQKEAAHV